jgi:hypothetical protein
MSGVGRVIAVLAFAVAYLTQPLALDACAVSCEAARAARGPVVAAPCHHTTSCATQITQPTTPGSTVISPAIVPTVVAISVAFHVVAIAHLLAYRPPQLFSSPPIPLRV